MFGEAFNGLHETFFVQAHQVHGLAIGPCAAGAANAVHIVFADVGNVVIDHVRQVVDVNAACRNVGGHQGAHFATFEASQCLGAGRLAFVAVQGHGVDAVLAQKLGHVVGPELGAGEHQHLAPAVLVDDVHQQRFFLATTDRVNQLGDALHGGVAGCDLHTLRVF